MGKALIKGTLLGGLVFFVWGAVSWMVLPWHGMTMSKFKNQEFVSMVLKENAPEKGIYVYPYSDCHEKKDMTKAEKKKMWHEAKKSMKEGPLVFAAISPKGIEMNAATFISSFVIQCIGAFLISVLLLKTDMSMRYWGRVFFVIVVTFTAGVMTNLPAWNWWGFPAGYTLVNIADFIAAGFFGGLVLAWAAKRPQTTT